MIKTKKDYLFYLSEDRKALGIKNTAFIAILRNLINPNYIWRFQYILRKFEYFKNCKQNSFLGRFNTALIYYRFQKISIKLGFSIPANVFGPGLAIVHYGTIVVNANAKVGSNCRIHPSTCIGASGGTNKAPIIGNNVYIAPGAKIFGEINIPNNTAIGANSVVNRSFNIENTMIAGVPAIIIKEINIQLFIKHIAY